VCHLDAERGRLTYRGYDVRELAERSSFEETAYLLVAGRLPAAAELRAFRQAWHAAGKLTADERRSLARVPEGADELTALRTAASALGLSPRDATATVPAVPAAAMLLMARVAAFATERLRLRAGTGRLRGRPGVAEALLLAQRGEAPTPLVRALDAALVLRADNELNPGTFAVRVAASTGADLVSAVVAGFGALAGPRHSAHTLKVYRLLEQVGEPGRAAEVARAIAASGMKADGFTHPVYKGEDPRTPVARRLAQEACEAAGRADWFRLAAATEEAVVESTGQRANVDFYLTSIYVACGFAPATFAPLFAVARTPGWLAHAIEQGRDPDLIRPRAQYVGPVEQAYRSMRARR
jgi:citrate synthase